MQLQDGGPLGHGEAREVALPLLLVAGRTTVRFEEAGEEPAVFQSLAEVTRLPGAGLGVRFSTLPPGAESGVGEAMVRWLHAAMDVLHSAAVRPTSSRGGLEPLVDLADLDAAGVVLLEGGEWKPQAVEAAPHGAADPDWKPSQRLLGRLRREKRTFWELPAAQTASLLGVRGVVAAPILNRQGEVDRRPVRRPAQHDLGQTPIRACKRCWSNCWPAAWRRGWPGWSRNRRPCRRASSSSSSSPANLSQQLTLQPDMLQGRDDEVTVLFCDIRGFSRMSEQLGPAKTVEWIAT